MKHETTARTTRQIRLIAGLGMVFSLLGIADASYLTIAHYTTKVVLACPATSFINCQKVTSSSYSEVHGVPLVILGLIFFVGMLFLQLPASWQSQNHRLRMARLIFSLTGLISVFWLVYVELYRIGSICLYCTGVHILTFLLFAVTTVGTALITPQRHPTNA
jgi:uncharacterized membrane protein